MTRLVRFANNATSKLAANLSAVGLTISLTPGDGAKFPALTAGQFFKGTLIKTDGTKEVVKVTARVSDTLTIQRANEAVAGVQTAYAFSAGDKFELRLTAQAIGDELDRLDAAAFLDVVNKSANYTIVEADVSKLIKTDTTAGNVTITLPQISTLTGSFEVQVSKNTGDANTVNVVRAGTDTINGLTSYILGSQYQCVWLVADLTTNTWTAITSASASNRVTDVFTGSGTAGPFTLSGDPGTKNNTDVYVGGVYQRKSTYTLSGTSLTLGGNVGVGVSIEVNWSQPLTIGTPSDGTVTTQKLASVIAPVVSSVNGGQIAGLRNKIINPFTENQRALISVADDTYCLDRWYVLTESGNVTVAQIADPEPGAPSAIRLTQPDATPKRMGIATIIESKDIRQYRSTAMNFAGRVKPSFTGNVRYAIIEHTGTADVVTSDVVSNWASATFTPSNFFIAGINILKTGTVAPGAATYADFSDWVALGASTNNVILFFWTESAQAQNATLEANRPQYEPGIVRTPQEWRLNELQLCQRYFWQGGYGWAGSCISATNGTVSGIFPVQMRGAPTFSTIAGAGTNALIRSGGANETINTVVNSNADKNGGWLYFGGGGYTAGSPYTVVKDLFTASAEL
jgi:hypothetical protein